MKSTRAEKNRKLQSLQSAMGRNWCWEDIKKVIGDLQLFLKILFEAVTDNVGRWFASVVKGVGPSGGYSIAE